MASTDPFKIPSFKILLVFVCLVLTGAGLVTRLPLKLAPEKDLPSLSVSFSMYGMSSRVVEMEVTSRLEAMLSRVEGVKEIRSGSDNGSGWITVGLSKHADPDVVRFELSNLIRQVYPELPDGVSYPVVSAGRSDEQSKSPAMTYMLNAPATPDQIQRFAENSLRQHLSSVQGVDRIEMYGATGQNWLIRYDNNKLNALGLKPSAIQKAVSLYTDKRFLGMAHSITGGSSANSWMRIFLTDDVQNQELDPARIVVANQAGKLIRLEELAQVSREDRKPQSYYRINGLNSVYLNVYAKEEANQLQLSGQIRERLRQLSTDFPAGYELHLSYDSSEYIKDQLNTILYRSGLTILILLAFILLIYRNKKYVLMIFCSLTGSLALAVILYNLTGLEMHVYSLMGLTISLNLMLDNIIVMADQIHRQRNRSAFLAILASSLTTVAAMSVVFFMDEKVRLNLQDFAAVIVLNLFSSLVVVLFLVPALMVKLGLINARSAGHSCFRKRRTFTVKFQLWAKHWYARYITWIHRKTGWVLLLTVLLFGTPVFMLPAHLEEENAGKATRFYNATLGSDFYNEKMRPVVNTLLGGTLRLFVEKVYQGSYWSENTETSINVRLSMPNGTTLDQTNYLIGRMEEYLTKYKRIKQFQTNVWQRGASINILFSNADQKGSFPFMLKSALVDKAVELGGGGWSVNGLGDYFSNNLAEQAGSNQIQMSGYNYDELYSLAETVRDTLLTHRRIKEVLIGSQFSYFKDSYEEFVFNLKKERLAEDNLSAQTLFHEFIPLFKPAYNIGTFTTRAGQEPVMLAEAHEEQRDIWWLNEMPEASAGRMHRIKELADIGRYQTPPSIVRENQQYTICLQYDYIGSAEQSGRILTKVVDEFKKRLPVGYDIVDASNPDRFITSKSRQYLLLLLIVGMIYFITSILFNSLRQPLAILFSVPVSFVGLFLTFYFFKLNFDQGGFAAFILLCGITVNAGIYIVNQYNQLNRRGLYKPMPCYHKAVRYRVIPVSLTVVATVLGFVPFLIGEKEGFWFPLAAGVIGGLFFSLIGLFLFLPALLTLRRKSNN